MDSIPWEDLEFVQDMARQFTTRSGEQLGYGRIDSDYKAFLKQALEHVASKQYVKKDNDDDAQYCTFLENLKEDGKSYVAKVAIDNNAPVFIKYEAEDAILVGETNVGSCPKGNHLFEVEWEPDYKMFVKNSKLEGDCLVFATKDGEQVTAEGCDVEIASDSEVFMTDNPSDFNRGNKNPFATSRLFDSFMEEDEWQLGSPEFREKLMGKLREPYNQKEYEKLWQIVNEQKLKDGRHRDLRGCAALKSYLIDECNQSYLERYSDLKRKIDAVKFDQCKVLNLLRGFFFWLENLVHQDAFQPWLDPSCLEVMPRNC